MHNSKTAVINGFTFVKKNTLESGKYEWKIAKKGSSQMYTPEFGMENGINSGKENTTIARTIEI